eukprot:6484750-Amphidinium_carterae.1
MAVVLGHDCPITRVDTGVIHAAIPLRCTLADRTGLPRGADEAASSLAADRQLVKWSGRSVGALEVLHEACRPALLASTLAGRQPTTSLRATSGV